MDGTIKGHLRSCRHCLIYANQHLMEIPTNNDPSFGGFSMTKLPKYPSLGTTKLTPPLQGDTVETWMDTTIPPFFDGYYLLTLQQPIEANYASIVCIYNKDGQDRRGLH